MSFGRKWSAFVLGGALLLSSAGVLPARAESCEERIHKAERNLEKEVQKHGEHSRQAEKKRHELEEARARCGDHDRDHDHH